MTEAAILERLHDSFHKEHAFVAFAYPQGRELHAYIQNSDALITWVEGQEGFVFAPFSGDYPAVVIPPKVELKAFLDAPASEETGGAQTTDHEESEEARERHIALVSKALEWLKGGALEKVVLSRKISRPHRSADSFEVFSRLLHTYPDAFRYLWHHPKVGTWMGATPETLLRIDRGTLQTMSLAGTQPWKGTTEVEWGTKEREEQAMVTRSILESIAPYTLSATAGDIRTVKAGKLLHLLTPIKAVLPEGKIPLDRIVSVLHPTPAVCGLPKGKARDFILKEEGYDRKYYTGYLGPVGGGQETRLFVNLRCMEVTPEHYNIYVGGGITADSNPESEWIETVNKSKTMMTVLL